MGYFVQISTDIGTPVFQAAKNYPEVSFASSTTFFALVTASLKQGFVPSVLRTSDAAFAVAAHGPPGARVSIALVTSEPAAGQTRDLEKRLHWRIGAIYCGALVAAGADVFLRQPAEAMKRLLGQRLSPIVERVMLEEAPGMGPQVPRLGLTVCGAAVEWLARLPAADSALERLIGALGLLGGGGSSASGTAVAAAAGGAAAAAAMDVAAVLAWQGRALAATAAWRRLAPLDRGLLLSMADHVGPATFEQPGRSWAFEEVDHLWLPSIAAAGAHAGAILESAVLAPVGADVEAPDKVDRGTSNRRARQHRMASIRIYPTLEPADLKECAVCRAQVLNHGHSASSIESQPGSPTSLAAAPAFQQAKPSEAEVLGLSEEDASLVFMLLQVEDQHGGGESILQGPVRADSLQDAAGQCTEALRELWAGIRARSDEDGVAVRRLLNRPEATLQALLLLDELSQDVITVPSPWLPCAALPWRCRGRQNRADAVRRLMYWIHSLPPLGPDRSQQYVYCEGCAVGAARREDGVHCWAIMDWGSSGVAAEDRGSSPDSISRSAASAPCLRGTGDIAEGISPTATSEAYALPTPPPPTPVSCAQLGASSEAPPQVLAAVVGILRQLPRSGDLRAIFGDRAPRASRTASRNGNAGWS